MPERFAIRLKEEGARGDDESVGAWFGVGVMCGSSLDGTDLALCRYNRGSDGLWTHDFIATETIPYEEPWGKHLLELPHASAQELASSHVAFGHYLSGLLVDFQARFPEPVHVVGVHGHTVFHDPDRGYTFQLGDGETIAAGLDCPVISNFRTKDIALGGQGAPLVPVGEQLLFPEIDCFLNLGGIVNLTTPVGAYDICTGNQALNELAEKLDPNLRFDPEGRYAAEGRVIESLLAALESQEYILRSPPKSLGREWYESQLHPLLATNEASVRDLLATYTEHIARQVARALEAYEAGSPKLLVTGGGYYNTYLLDRIKSLLEVGATAVVDPASSDLVLFKEAMIFGFLGLLNLLGETNIDASFTGARKSVIGGSIHQPFSGARWKAQNERAKPLTMSQRNRTVRSRQGNE